MGREALMKAAGDAARAQGAAWVSLHLAMAGKLGLTAVDARVYDLLLRRGPLTAGEIAQATGLTSGSVTALIDRLAARGLVQRMREGKDRRRVFVHADTAAMAPEMARFAAELEALNAGYDEDGLRLVAGYLLKMAALAERAAGRM